MSPSTLIFLALAAIGLVVLVAVTIAAWGRLAEGLSQKSEIGQIVRAGRMVPFNFELCEQGTVPCFGQNPASPYTRPVWTSGVGPIPPPAPTTEEAILFGAFTLTDTQAFVMRGLTPPECVYFAFTPYVYSTPNCAVNGEVVRVTASAADSTNNIDFKLLGVPPFNTPFTIIYSYNLPLGEALAEQGRRNGDVTFFVPIKRRPNVLFSVVGRTANFVDENAGKMYLSNTGINTAIVDAPEFSSGPFQTTSIFKPRSTAINTNTVEINNALAEASYNLQSILSRNNISGWVNVPSILYPNADSGDDCINGCFECLIDNRDAVYRVAEFNDFGSNAVGFAISDNHVTRGQALYTNLSVYDTDRQLGLFSVDIFAANTDYNTVIIAREGSCFNNQDYPGTIVYLVPPEVVNVAITERVYLQTANGENISPAPETLPPFVAARGVCTELTYPGEPVDTAPCTSTVEEEGCDSESASREPAPTPYEPAPVPYVTDYPTTTHHAYPENTDSGAYRSTDPLVEENYSSPVSEPLVPKKRVRSPKRDAISVNLSPVDKRRTRSSTKNDQ